METSLKCACGCGRGVHRRSRSGPAPIYATPGCRVRALRLRRLGDEIQPLPDVIKNAPVPLPTASTDAQVRRAIIEARAIGFALQRLGRQARPDFAWRCTRVGDALIQALEDNFGEGLK